jgi:hypothetical protein
MTKIVKPRFHLNLILLTAFGLAMSAHSASAATVVLKNNWHAAAEIGFDGAPAIKLAPARHCTHHPERGGACDPMPIRRHL